MLNTRSSPGAGLARLAVLVLALGGGLAAQETPAAPAPAPAPAVEPATPPAATETQAASDARTTVQAGEADVAVLATAAAQLLALGDYDSLRTVLAGERRAALALLQALAMQPPASVEPLLDDLLDLATRAASDEVGVAADGVIALLAATRPPSADALLAELRQPDQSAGRRAAILRALGSSGNLALSGVLIEALDTPQAPTARAALRRLTGHELGPDAGAADWRAFFERNAGLSRDRLLESALSSERESFEMQRQVLVAEVIKVRIASLGTDDPVRLVEGLADEYPGVRLEASKRLAAFRSQEQVALVVPAILRQLGYAPAGENGGAAAPVPASAPDAPDAPATPAVEADPLVRAALLETLGAVGRQREDVRLALQAELRGGDERVAAAAAGALCGVHDQPAVVGPLLDYLDRRPPPTNAEEVLKAIAANQPDGALERLQPWLAKDQPEGVRAAAVRAVVACDAIDAALDLLSRLDAEGETQKVRWAMAVALGDRLPGLKPDQPAHAQAVLLLARQLDAAEPNVRGEAVTALGHAGTPEVLPLLEKRAAVETDLAVQRCIIVSLGSLKLPEGGGLIGRILSRSKEARTQLEPDARAALADIAKDRGPDQWLLLGEAVSGAGAHNLAVACYRELIKQYEDKPEHKDAVQRAFGRLANDLYLDGRAEEALQVLAELEQSQAPYPSQMERLDLAARANESLDRFSEAAEFHLRRYALLPEGEIQRTSTLKSAVTALSKAGNHKDALAYLKQLCVADPENNQLLYEQAREEEALGELEQAEINLQRLLKRIPSDDTAFLVEVNTALTRVRAKARGEVPLTDGKPG